MKFVTVFFLFFGFHFFPPVCFSADYPFNLPDNWEPYDGLYEGPGIAAVVLRPFSVDPESIISTTKVALLDPTQGQNPTILTFSGKVSPVVFSPDGSKFIIRRWLPDETGKVSLHSRYGALLWERTVDSDFFFKFSADSNSLTGKISFRDDPRSKRIEVWGLDASPKKVITRPAAPDDYCLIEETGNYFVLSGNRLTCVSPLTGAATWEATVPIEHPVHEIKVVPGGKILIPSKSGKFWVYNQSGLLVYSYDPEILSSTRGQLTTAQYSSYVPYPAQTIQGPRVFLWNGTNRVLVLDTNTWQINDLLINSSPPNSTYQKLPLFVPVRLAFWKLGSLLLRQY